MNVKMAIKMAKMDGIDVKYVVATDDLASQPKKIRKIDTVLLVDSLCGKLVVVKLR